MPKAKSLWEAFQQQEGMIPRAVRKFTGRQDFRQAYYALAARALKEDFEGYYIMNYHGDGGVGKSSLLRRLEEELLGDGELPEDEARSSCQEVRERLQKLSRRQKPVILRADFDDTALKTPEDVLLRFRAQLLRQYDKAMFPLLDMAMLRLSQKYGRSLPPDEQKEMLTDNPVISFALDVVGDLTGVGLLIGAAQTAAKVGQGVARTLAGRKNAIRKANAEMTRMDAPDLERRLPCYFAMDVNAMDLPMVCVYLDTYEKAQAGGAGFLDEEWLRGNLGLVRNLGSAVFAIAGRKGLEWPGLPLEAYHMEARRVKALSEADSTAFLTSCGIQDSELCHRLYELTGGEPIWLDLCVDEYESLTASGRERLTIEDFGGERELLVERYTRYIPQNLLDALYLLAAMGRWTDAVCEELARTLPIPFPAGTEYYRLTHLSYIREEESGWAMHRPVAKVLSEKLSPALWKRMISALLEAARRDPTALDILDGMPWIAPDPRVAQAMEEQARIDCGAGRYTQARRWQERAIELRKAGHAAQYGESLAGLADILRTQLKNQPVISEESGEMDKGLSQGQKSWQALREFCRESIETCQGLGDSMEGALARLWERKANAEDMLSEWDAAISSWTQVMGLDQRLGQTEAVWRNAQLQIGWDHRLAGHDEAARAVLENVLIGLAALNREAGRAYSPKTLLAAELLCQSYENLNIGARGVWDERLAQIQTWLRSLDYDVTGKEPLEELLDWQDWVDVSHSSYWFHSGVGTEGADVSERLRRAADLDRNVTSGQAKRLGELHPTVLNARRTLVNIYLNQEDAKGVGAVINTDYLIQCMEDDWRPLGSVPESNECHFPNPETVLATCRELVELYTMAMGRVYSGTYEAKELLVHAYEVAGLPKDAISLREELWSYYSGAYGEGSREALRQNFLLIEDNRKAGRWGEAIALQTRRLEQNWVGDSALPLDPERDRLCTLYLSRLWQDEELPQEGVRECLAELLALVEEFKPGDRRRYLDSAWRWCLECPESVLEEADVALNLADSLGASSGDEVIDLLEPYSRRDALSDVQRAAVLLRLGRAYRGTRSGKERSVELLEELVELLEAHPEVKDPDRGSALLELGLAQRKLAVSLVGDSRRQTALGVLDSLRKALAWWEERLPPENPATDAARFELASALAWAGKTEEAIPLLEAVAAFRKRTLGEADEETIEAEEKLILALACTEGRYEQARALLAQVQRLTKGQRPRIGTLVAQHALYCAAGGKLSFEEWGEASRPERG